MTFPLALLTLLLVVGAQHIANAGFDTGHEVLHASVHRRVNSRRRSPLLGLAALRMTALSRAGGLNFPSTVSLTI